MKLFLLIICLSSSLAHSAGFQFITALQNQTAGTNKTETPDTPEMRLNKFLAHERLGKPGVCFLEAANKACEGNVSYVPPNNSGLSYPNGCFKHTPEDGAKLRRRFANGMQGTSFQCPSDRITIINPDPKHGLESLSEWIRCNYGLMEEVKLSNKDKEFTGKINNIRLVLAENNFEGPVKLYFKTNEEHLIMHIQANNLEEAKVLQSEIAEKTALKVGVSSTRLAKILPSFASFGPIYVKVYL